MKRPKLAGVFLLAGCLLAYLMFVKRHYSAAKPEAYRLPPHLRPATHQPADVRPVPAAAAAAGHSFQYGIMFDAGSTGTRVHVFKFQMENNEAPKLAHETFRAIKPGLSAYADDPEKCTAGILELLLVAKSSVPPSVWDITPVVLKATAGLRLLPGEKAKHLLDRVRALFEDSPFLSRDDSVSIMDGTDEGISAWITVNFLTGDLHSVDSSTVGMLDLGGGSTQITFSPQDEKTIQTSPIDYIRSFQMFNNTHTVYTHSYLGLGLMSARLTVLGGVDASPLGGSTELVSPCLPPESSVRWEHADVIYTVKGQKAGEPVYEACLTKVEKVLYRKVMKASEAEDVEFYAFSYYYDRAVDLGVIDLNSHLSHHRQHRTVFSAVTLNISQVFPGVSRCLQVSFGCFQVPPGVSQVSPGVSQVSPGVSQVFPGVSLRCFSGVSQVFLRCFQVFPGVSLRCFQVSLSGVSRCLSQVSLRCFQVSLPGVFQVFPGVSRCLSGVSRCLSGVSRCSVVLMCCDVFVCSEEKTGGTIRVADYITGAKRVCSGPSVSPLQSPFLCLDLVYISVLLQELGFPPHKQFKLARTIGGVETSWALGATFHYIESLKRH